MDVLPVVVRFLLMTLCVIPFLVSPLCFLRRFARFVVCALNEVFFSMAFVPAYLPVAGDARPRDVCCSLSPSGFSHMCFYSL